MPPSLGCAGCVVSVSASEVVVPVVPEHAARASSPANAIDVVFSHSLLQSVISVS